jgi:hypothetical protein
LEAWGNRNPQELLSIFTGLKAPNKTVARKLTGSFAVDENISFP